MKIADYNFKNLRLSCHASVLKASIILSRHLPAALLELPILQIRRRRHPRPTLSQPLLRDQQTMGAAKANTVPKTTRRDTSPYYGNP